MAGADLLVVGGGVAGLAVAWEALGRGLSVTVLERDSVGAGASQASAGILAPAGRACADPDLNALCWEGIRAFPDWVGELTEAAPGDVGLAMDGVIYPPDDRATEREEGLAAVGEPCEWIEGPGVAAAFPWLALDRALYAPTEGRVHPRLLMFLLRDACVAAGAEVLEGTEVTSLTREGGGWSATTPAGRVQAGAVAVAAGAWQGPDGCGWSAPVRPVKGQLIEVRGDPEEMPDRCIHGAEAYLAVQGPGVGWVGTSVEEAGFDESVDRGLLFRRIATVARWAPGLRRAEIGEAWCGFRPGTPDDRPVLGERSEEPGLFWATGLFRNGIQLAPEVGRLAGAWLAGEPPAAAFSPARFP